MDWQDVKSSTIAAVGYEPAGQTLHVRFNGGREYHYHGVPAETHGALVQADAEDGGSVGKTFHSLVRPRFDHCQECKA